MFVSEYIGANNDSYYNDRYITVANCNLWNTEITDR